MGISFAEIITVFLVGMLFFKPSEIKSFLQSVFSAKKDLEQQTHNALNTFLDEKPSDNSVEFFDVETKCQKQQ